MKSRGSTGLFVAGVYGGSVGLLFLADAVLSARIPPEVFGEYTLTRNALPLVVTAALFGVDQALIRVLASRPASGALRSIMIPRLIRVALAGTTGGVILVLLGTKWISALVLVACAGAVCVSELVSAALRGKGSYVASSVLQQGYRLVLGILLLCGVFLGGTASYAYILLAFFVACWSMGIASLVKGRSLLAEPSSQKERIGLNRLAVGFGISMLSFAIIDWLDQATVSILTKDLVATGEYNIHKLWGVYPLVSLASIGGFLLMPELVRRREELTATGLKRLFLLAGAFSLLLSGAVLTLASTILPHIVEIHVDPLLLSLFAMVGAARLFYLVPSAVLGAVGADHLIRRTSLYGLAPVAFMPLIALAAALALDAKIAVAGALLIATIVRVGISVDAAVKAVACPAL